MSTESAGQGLDSKVQVTRSQMSDGLREDGEVSIVKLGDKLKALLVLLGYDNAHIYNAAIKLVVQGKVRIDYRNRTERLELVDQRNRLPRVEAIALVDAFISKLREADRDGNPGTERIVL